MDLVGMPVCLDNMYSKKKYFIYLIAYISIQSWKIKNWFRGLTLYYFDVTAIYWDDYKNN